MDDFKKRLNHLIAVCQLNLDNDQLTGITKSTTDQINSIIHLHLNLPDNIFTDDLLCEEQEKKLLFKIEQVADFFWNQWWKTGEHHDSYALDYLKNVRQLNAKIFHLYKITDEEKRRRLANEQTIEELYLNFKFEPTWSNILKYINSNNISSLQLQNSVYLKELSLWFDQVIHIVDYVDYQRQSRSLLADIENCLLTPFYKQCLLSSEIYCRPIDKFYMGTCASYFTQYYVSEHTQRETIVPLMHSNRLYVIHRSKFIDQWSNDILYCLQKVLAFLTADYHKTFPHPRSHISEKIRTELYLPNHDEYLEALMKILEHQRFNQRNGSPLSTDEEKLVLLIIQYLKLTSIRPTISNALDFLRSKNALDICLPYLHSSYGSIHGSILPLVTILSNETSLDHSNMADTITCLYFDVIENRSYSSQEALYEYIHALNIFATLIHHKSIQDVIARHNKIYFFLLLPQSHMWCTNDFLWTLSFSSIIRKQLNRHIEMLRTFENSMGLLWTIGDRFTIKSLRCIEHYSDEKSFFGVQQDIILDSCLDDIDVTKQICYGLIANGYRVQFDEEKDDGNYTRNVYGRFKMKIEGCDSIKTIVVCLSNDYEKSNACRAVLYYALQKRLKIVPIIIEKHYKMQCYLEEIFNDTEIINFSELKFDDGIDLLSDFISNQKNESSQLLTTPITNDRTCSLYEICKNNDYNLLKEYISQFTLEQINEIQPDGSTALHVAVSNNNKEMVRLLLNNGASRSIRDKQFELTAYEKTCSNVMKYLFKRPCIFQRFLRDLSYQLPEWTKTTFPSDNQSLSEFNYHEILEIIKTTCSSSNGVSFKEKKTINWYLERAINDPTYFLRAYTSVTNFSVICNKYFIENTDKMVQYHRLINEFKNNCSFEPLSYLGETYQGMLISSEDVIKFNVGSKITIKTFVSTTKDWLQAELAAVDGQRDYLRRTADLNFSYFATICKYRIKKRHTAYDIQSISEVSDEQEILILPSSIFTVRIISQYDETAKDGIIYIFELEECEQ